MKHEVLVVGAGFAGSVTAERLASAGHKVLVIDRRPHIAGNAYDELDAGGVLVHRYGPHIFHTQSDHVVAYLSRFTDWHPYEHRVLSSVNGELYPVPINRTTINRFFGLTLEEREVPAFLDSIRESFDQIRNSEDLVLSRVGRQLCNAFFRNYTKKQWNLDLSELSPIVAGRIPVRTNDDDRYFTDSFQKMPADGYTRMFERMLDHPGIEVRLGVDFHDVAEKHKVEKIFYTGPIDEYYAYCYGKLPYRSLRFEHQHLPDTDHFQPVATVNYPNEQAYTRITEFKHMTGQRLRGTSIVREYPQGEGDPYYPIPTAENQARYQQYRELSERDKQVIFLGRLGEYRYYNMDQVVAATLKAVQEILAK